VPAGADKEARGEQASGKKASPYPLWRKDAENQKNAQTADKESRKGRSTGFADDLKFLGKHSVAERPWRGRGRHLPATARDPPGENIGRKREHHLI